jgi:hypothetical protein
MQTPLALSQAIRRAAANMRQNGSRDLFILARAALEGAIRNRDDLFALLDATAPPGRIPAKAKVVPVEAHASMSAAYRRKT